MAEGDILLDGWLEKKGEKGLVKLYLRRWFEVKMVGGELRATYSASVGGSELGHIPLKNISEIQASCENNEDFTVSVPGRIYYLRAEDEMQRNEWMTGLDMKQAEALPKYDDSKNMSHGTVLLNSFPNQQHNDGQQAYLDLVANTPDNDATNSATDYYGKKEKSPDGGYGVLVDQVYYGSHGGSPIPKQKKGGKSPKLKKKGGTSPKPAKK
eukprot:CAMPEP_0201527590 /NCGR_PEP_ID=MMETSP0161_2-20130828/35668_1 /ASSEMBLY_ACC=CAM_ASM_000251 /TAXON_ID=180227 /ORGANISM="Neoparamoeba aestuarina, Strain SoJaBio B1-5/56/2" /LENGTH=210 /DNA_ID=CAMNT_0047928483 /DNA_START=93 /DNA_END=725 /DNA_ORIENTATION=-